MVALGGATPECPRVGIRYWRCPSPTSTWGAATSRPAAVATTLTPSACRRRTVPATSQIPLCRPSPPPPPPLPLTPAADNERKRERNAPYKARDYYHHYHPNPPRNHRPPHQPSSRTTTTTTTNYHAPPSRVILVKVNKRARFLLDEAPSLAISPFPITFASHHVTPTGNYIDDDGFGRTRTPPHPSTRGRISRVLTGSGSSWSESRTRSVAAKRDRRSRSPEYRARESRRKMVYCTLCSFLSHISSYALSGHADHAPVPGYISTL